ncbi:hypothetical protein CC2G_007206 [Coprinopsis cinerea AmutBmut pab1-1]|nr:hypothetical protein CC2G_007206 [Coprinopsis cinerea AmutBmut pab1-1]
MTSNMITSQLSSNSSNWSFLLYFTRTSFSIVQVLLTLGDSTTDERKRCVDPSLHPYHYFVRIAASPSFALLGAALPNVGSTPASHVDAAVATSSRCLIPSRSPWFPAGSFQDFPHPRPEIRMQATLTLDFP